MFFLLRLLFPRPFLALLPLSLLLLVRLSFVFVLRCVLSLGGSVFACLGLLLLLLLLRVLLVRLLVFRFVRYGLWVLGLGFPFPALFLPSPLRRVLCPVYGVR